MSNFNYDTYCGIYCGACSILRAYKTGNKDNFASYWTKSTLKDFLKGQGVSIAEGEDLSLKCHGCKTDTIFINCKYCKIRTCAISKKVEHCNDCEQYPCNLLNNTLLNEEIQKQLPHLKAALDNLNTIKNAGVNNWLEQQEKQWKCPECDTTSSWYTFSCPSCGKDLTGSKDYGNK